MIFIEAIGFVFVAGLVLKIILTHFEKQDKIQAELEKLNSKKDRD